MSCSAVINLVELCNFKMLVSDVHINMYGKRAESHLSIWGVGVDIMGWNLLTQLIKCFEIFIVLVFCKCPKQTFINLINRKRDTL